MFCLQCGKQIGDINKNWICPYCEFEQYPKLTEADFQNTRKFLNGAYASKKKKEKGFTDEEILALGLYPNDEGYKMSLISKILGKKR